MKGPAPEEGLELRSSDSEANVGNEEDRKPRILPRIAGQNRVQVQPLSSSVWHPQPEAEAPSGRAGKSRGLRGAEPGTPVRCGRDPAGV